MFRSTYGYVSSDRSPGSAGLAHKAVDFERSIEIFRIGVMGGEDVPFHGDIFCFRSPAGPFAFVYAEVPLGRVALMRFNRSAWWRESPGAIRVVAGAVFNIGIDLQAVETGPRGQVLVDSVIARSLRVVGPLEAEGAFALIREALPLIRFDEYGLLGPSPAICISVQHAPSPTAPSSPVEDEALKIGERLLFGQATSCASDTDVIARLQVLAATQPLRLETLFAEILDVERRMFTHGPSAMVPFAGDARFWDLLRASYDAYYREHCDSFERFLLSAVGLVGERGIARRLFDEGLGPLRGDA